MNKTTVSVDNLSADEHKQLEEWNRIFQFASHRELIEYVIFLGHLANEMDVVGKRIDGVASRNALYSMGSAFLRGEFRSGDGPPFYPDQDLEETVEFWQEYLDISSKAATERHLISVGLMVYGLASGPIDAERFLRSIGFLARSLFKADIGKNIEQSVKEYRLWQRNRTPKNVIRPRVEQTRRVLR